MSNVLGAPNPICFSIPECKIVREIPRKVFNFAPLIPGDMSTYIYKEEGPYYRDYQRSYYAVTRKKAGWDCMRHYEILACGCIPYFIDLESCDENTMHLLPRKLILEAMHLEGVSYLNIDHSKFNRKRYFEILDELLAYTRQHLTTKAMAQYLLQKVNYSGSGKILFLAPDLYSDYMRDLTLIGLKELYTSRIIDYPKIPFIYSSYEGNTDRLWGRGMSYTRILPDIYAIDRENIPERIASKEFDLIIYGSVHRGQPFLDLVQATYPPEKIVYICGEDHFGAGHDCCQYTNRQNMFLREFEAYR
jgi:hypothetical protein